ncbi:ABC transporter ATP-binding protein [Brevibacillus marinus]|uniref:ABC transporter ATP-binding protein n=1 Tax=Brevibacillus marinus TaxID=2496837 RepID=UPI000F843271|nr:ABC transporter ATP-binding protein [Brevibacillus marinus]
MEILKMKRITKKFGAFTANDEVNFTLRQGEIHALVGENGAGKTTLMRILYGLEPPTSGEIEVKGQTVRFQTPADAIRHGIGMVHQHFMLFPSRTVMENIVIGQESARGIFFDRERSIEQINQLCQTYSLAIDPHARISDCPVGMQQRVEILKVLYRGAEIMILDEPTAVLTPLEVQELLRTLKHLARQGKSIILITHKLHEVMEVADHITVLRGGKVTASLPAAKTNIEEISRYMVGRGLVALQREPRPVGEPVLQVENVTLRGSAGKPLLDRVSFQVCAGEIVGIAGVSGNGQSELIQVITGLRKHDSGTIKLLGQDISRQSVEQIRAAGLAHIPEDRYLWGAAKEASVLETAMMGHHRKPLFQRKGLLRQKTVEQTVREWVKRFQIKTASLAEQTQNLSGGNLQKLIVAREIAHDTPFLLAAEPTRGVDIGAMEFIHQQLLEKRNRGEAVLLISSELTEIMSLADRILVMFEGKIVGELNRADVDEQRISLLMAGGQ